MADPNQRGGRFRFGDFEADLHAGELRKHGRKLRVTGRPMQILGMLLERPGELLTRKELQEKLWPADTFVDFEHGVNSAVQTLRRALCDSHKTPRFIETLPRRGYRFIAQVSRIDRAAQGFAGAAVQGAISNAVGAEGQAGAETNLAAIGGDQADSPLVGTTGTVIDPKERNFVLLPRDESALAEMEACEAASDDLGISLLVAASKLLMVACGTNVKILDARRPERGCYVRILGGEFIGEKAFVPRKHLEIAASASAAGSALA
jgi:DNA-binding winged helix-turn-helix (wHTH) protein